MRVAFTAPVSASTVARPFAAAYACAMRVFVAGASGVIGRRLVPLLVSAGHEVTGTTRSAAKAGLLRDLGATPAVVDVFDAQALRAAVAAMMPEVVIHQLTDLGSAATDGFTAELLERNARLREEGTASLLAAAVSAGAHRLIAQSIAWLYAPGPEPHPETHPLRSADGSDVADATLRGVLSLERQVLEADALHALVLRYGRLYGPGTWSPDPPEPPHVHVDAAAFAAALAVERGSAGVYNVVDDAGPVADARAKAELGWSPDFRIVS